MEYVNIQLPVLVENKEVDGKLYYFLRPLFFEEPMVSRMRYEVAVQRMKSEIGQLFKDYILTRASSDRLLWHLFNPDIQFEVIPLSFRSGKGFVSGHFAVGRFVVKNIAINYFPHFDNHMSISERPATEKNIDNQEVTGILEKLLRNLRKRHGDDFNIENYYSDKATFITTIQMDQAIEQGQFRFLKPQQESFFSHTHESQIFKGAVEITKIGHELNNKFPGNLQRAHLRDDLVDRISQLTYQKENAPFVMVGPKGVGKQSILEEAVFRYLEAFQKENNNKPSRKLWQIDPNRVISGMSYVGWWQKRMEAVLDFVIKRNIYANLNLPPDVLVIDNAVALLRVGESGQNSMTLSDLLKPYIENRSLQLILLASPAEWKVVQEKDRRFSDLFQVIRIAEPDYETSVKIVLENRRILERKQGCEFTINSIRQILNLHRTYLQQQALPGSVLRLMNQLSTKYRFQTIDSPQVKAEFEEQSRLNEYIFDSSIKLTREEISEVIDAKLIGQPKAVDALTDVVSIIKAKLNRPGKPLGSFMFIGPTGVGKTQAAKVLSEYLMGNEAELTRFDMNEFNTPDSADRLIGDYFNPDGLLTEKLRYQPFNILLLDEIEKAHPMVHDLFLQLLDEGRLTDKLGRTVDCSNVIIIMTSNIGAKEVASRLGYETAGRNDADIYRKAMENRFRPEFINRIDRIVIFDPLQFPDILRIARLQIKELLQRDGFVRRTTILNISTEALEWVAKRGFDEKMGGRALKRQIERDLTSLSAEQLISSYSNLPVIFEILWEDDSLRPYITPLDFALPNNDLTFPTFPEEGKGRKFYYKLISVLDGVEKRVRFSEDRKDTVLIQTGQNLNWMPFHFKDLLSQLKENITELSLAYGSSFIREKVLTPIRLKSNFILQTAEDGTNTIATSQQSNYNFFQEDALDSLKEGYQYKSSRFATEDSEFLNYYLSVRFMKLFTRGFLSNSVDDISLRFVPLTDLEHEQEQEDLILMYLRLLEDLDIPFTRKEDVIELKWYNIAAFLSGELGVHLFHRSHKNPILIRLDMIENGKTINIENQNKIIRVYERGGIIYDLRTNLTNVYGITAAELKVLVFGGIEALPEL
ncbi:MAG: ATP-dependent Clp protease ATP-binding subunit ClpC [Flavobacteriales bacterium]|jgi:ATP-dependent Clp protease ATP-binding subunit ClpC